MIGWLRRVFTRASPENPSTSLANPDAWLYEALGAGPSSAGIVVSQETAVRVTAVMACVRVIAESVASLPLHVYRRLERGKERATGHPAYALLHSQPNPAMTSYVWREVLQAHLLLWGNAYAEIERNRAGRPIALWPITPRRVEPLWDDAARRKVYRIALPQGGSATVPDEDMIHVPGLGFDGFKGVSPLTWLRNAVGLAIATEEHGARLFKQGTLVGGVLMHPGQLSEQAQKNLRSSLERAYSGLGNAHRLMILEEGMKWQSLGMTSEDAQFLETRKFQVTEIARAFRVPPHLIGDLEKATYSNIEQQSLEFVQHTLRPWLVRWEQELTRKLLGDGYFAEFAVEGLLRGDIKSRYEAYAVGRQWGWLSANDVRELENLSAIEDGDEYLVPLNMGPAQTVGDQRRANAVRRIVRDAAIRVARREADRISGFLQRGDTSALAGWVSEHREYVRQVLEPACLIAGADPERAVQAAMRGLEAAPLEGWDRGDWCARRVAELIGIVTEGESNA